jgi:hypothetical protein
MRSLLAAMLLCGIAGCARQPQLNAASSVTPTPCDADRAPAESETQWMLAKGDGFTYCVPSDWKPIGPRATRWTSNTVDVSWGEASAFGGRAPFVVPTRGQTGARFGSRVVTETIDGKSVRLEITDGAESSSWMAAASWLEPSLRFQATARSASASRDVLAVIRSVRFGK